MILVSFVKQVPLDPCRAPYTFEVLLHFCNILPAREPLERVGVKALDLVWAVEEFSLSYLQFAEVQILMQEVLGFI